MCMYLVKTYFVCILCTKKTYKDTIIYIYIYVYVFDLWYCLKIFEIDLVNKILWYLTFWPHPNITSLTLGWKFTCILFWSSSPSIWYATEQLSRLICFISSICKNKQTVCNKKIWNWLCYWNLNDFGPFDPFPGPQGAGANFYFCCCMPQSCE